MATWLKYQKMTHARRAVVFMRERCKWTADGCLVYTGKSNRRSGHIQTFLKNERWYIHRFVYHHLVAPVPAHLQVCHTCDNPRCVNLDHLWLGTQRENSLDMVSKKRQAFMKKTHCKNGHPFTAENTRMVAGGRWRQMEAVQNLPASSHAYECRLVARRSRDHAEDSSEPTYCTPMGCIVTADRLT